MKLPLNCDVDYNDIFLTQEESQLLYTTLIEQYKLHEERIVINAGGKIIKTDINLNAFS